MSVTKTIRVKGMFCVNCEERLRKSVGALPGVNVIKASFEEGIITLLYDEELTGLNKINETIENLGYEVVSQGESYVKIVSVLVIIVALYVIADRLGFTSIFNIFPSIDSSLGYGMLFVTGVLTSIHCIGMCGGINLAQSTNSASKKVSNLKSNLSYNAGRVVSYTLVGGLAGLIGQVLTPTKFMRGAVALVAGVVMIIMSLSMLGVFKPLRRLPLHLPRGLYSVLNKSSRKGYGSNFRIGLINGLMPCGPLQAMQIYAISTMSLFKGALSMLLFALGTVPLMLGFGLVSGRLNRKYASIMLTVSAVLIFAMGIHMSGTGLALSGFKLPEINRAEDVRSSVVKGDVQYITTYVDYGEYESFEIQEGIPLQWTIVVPEGKLNGCNGQIIIPKYDVTIDLHEGENVVSLPAMEEGTIPYSCWMGMITGTIDVS
ncbi:MAG: sulfite exporter TauE/SafE family protein [Clostridiales bacterium]|nr:sulfite exporter TauE/SafE family protein [Clostridiales bacterium]